MSKILDLKISIESVKIFKKGRGEKKYSFDIIIDGY